MRCRAPVVAQLCEVVDDLAQLGAAGDDPASLTRSTGWVSLSPSISFCPAAQGVEARVWRSGSSTVRRRGRAASYLVLPKRLQVFHIVAWTRPLGVGLGGAASTGRQALKPRGVLLWSSSNAGALSAFTRRAMSSLDREASGVIQEPALGLGRAGALLGQG